MNNRDELKARIQQMIDSKEQNITLFLRKESEASYCETILMSMLSEDLLDSELVAKTEMKTTHKESKVTCEFFDGRIFTFMFKEKDLFVSGYEGLSFNTKHIEGITDEEK